ncbi:MAG TPA: triose-phosphate isomerase [Herpetosiphon sp.]|uniref:Triosephosphate isomerase n=1 Tax=Herpetosiphon aurantiacus (strain ATCC 23779 / DSM 785 / 114-95) TaxID=316274 RepID=TPIS_HERA2|nr:triose-phosphate isomerase [Herpetosiphon sp.]A9AUN9.1 RecName: Full=Triosephosphate isomerase; Short=TIM; Short=TPI; AltName: Full=Triose-phosphate isomerase [Herpetosiphon aurantiacus DSM 785]ABX04566.1 Triose-phosphate isomerase [Herpetosiphon aurantiacus DSM 785]HBW50039.1 triose-phosphate isomerase [Herpetosiphon sp.]
MRRPLLAGNWKMHYGVSEGVALVEALSADLTDLTDRDVLVCPPFTLLGSLAPLLDGTAVALGAQNMHYEAKGAYTGEIAPQMLKELGCSYVILGHSERRQYFGETDALINRKAHAALANGLKPIVCVGEVKAERDSGQAESVVVGQLRGSLAGLSAEQLRGVVIAYEPVWAIGTGDTATPADAQAMHARIRAELAALSDQATADAVIIQYGGSVKPDNVDELMAQPDIDGALVGGASLKAADFIRIVRFK